LSQKRIATSGTPSLLKSPVTSEEGALLPVVVWIGNQPTPGVLVPRVAVPSEALPKLASRKETLPVGAAEPPKPSTVAVSEYAPGAPKAERVTTSE
jgi:hypothetical protein